MEFDLIKNQHKWSVTWSIKPIDPNMVSRLHKTTLHLNLTCGQYSKPFKYNTTQQKHVVILTTLIYVYLT